MIGNKTFLWAGAALLSAVSIPAIGATIHHKRLAAKPAAHTVHATKPTAVSVKPAVHASKPTTLIATHTVKAKKLVKHAKAAKSAKTLAHGSIGVVAMHSGKGSVSSVLTPASMSSSHLLAATTTKKKLPH